MSNIGVRVILTNATVSSYHRQPMAIPAETSVHMKATLVGKAGNDVLDGSSQDVPIVGKTRGKWRAIIEGVPV